MNRILKWLGYIIGGLLALLIIAAGIIYFQSESVLSKTYTAPMVNVTIPTDAETIARGKYLVEHVAVCVDCHGENLGSGVVVDDPALGRIIAPNLTTGRNGRGGVLSNADIVRVLRYGVMADNTSALIMPSEDYTNLSDTDLGAIIAYVRSAPPVDSDGLTHELRPLGRILLALGQLPLLTVEDVAVTERFSAPPAGVTAEYGKYLAYAAGCTGCHGPGLSGGPIPAAPPDWPPALNITTAGVIASWSEADFISAIRTGVDKTGHQISPIMPWKRYAGMSDADLKAIWLFVSNAPPKEYGNR